ncbi:hypothetical protein ACFU7Z_29190 [Kitasatospora sp. NPDC057518]|uniref:hypothetical protein n=1 Tax=Kitasatospora sp. NPDC057518 TaxID=3346155 RepID=UPI003688444C
MAETARQEEAVEPGVTRICARCSGTRKVTVIGHVEQQTGAGWTVWGCDDCAPILRKLIG